MSVPWWAVSSVISVNFALSILSTLLSVIRRMLVSCAGSCGYSLVMFVCCSVLEKCSALSLWMMRVGVLVLSIVIRVSIVFGLKGRSSWIEVCVGVLISVVVVSVGRVRCLIIIFWLYFFSGL